MRNARWSFLLFGFLWAYPLWLWADDDLSRDPGPTPTFFTDHSYDNDDVDGTTLKDRKPNEVDLDAPKKTAKDEQALSVLDQNQLPVTNTSTDQSTSEIGAPVKGAKESAALTALGMDTNPKSPLNPTPTHSLTQSNL